MRHDIQLAIVIPVYKDKFLVEALDSLCSQTDKRFRVYLGDDASPGPIRGICARYQQQLNLVYHRFPENLGRDFLVDQWHRCIQLSSEPWIWLFSDDDVMEPGCVEAFYVALDQTKGKYDLYRFNTRKIDEQGQMVEICPPHPLVESGLEFAYHRLRKNRSSFVSENIFSRQVFNENEGMVKFPLAWCTDDASWIAFAGEKGIFTIYGPMVSWRKSRLNISHASQVHRTQKIEACGLFLEWLTGRYGTEKTRRELHLDYRDFSECCKIWLHSQLAAQAPLGPARWVKLSKNTRFSFFGGPVKRFLTMLYIDLVYWVETMINLLAGLFNKALNSSSPRGQVPDRRSRK